MSSGKSDKLFGSALFTRPIHLYRGATAGAILTCFAIILNVGPFARAPKTIVLGEKGPPAGAQIIAKPVTSAAALSNEPNAGARLEGAQPAGPQLASVDDPSSAADDNSRWAMDLVGSARPVVLAGSSLPASPPPAPVDAPAPNPVDEPVPNADTQSSPQGAPLGVADVPVPASRPTSAIDQGGDRSGTPAAGETASVIPASDTQPDDADADAKNASFIGVWAPNAGTCSASDFRAGALPAVISADGAWAGETFCMFSSKKQTDTGLSVVAKCTSPKERWTAKVRLTVKDNRLKWASRRGTQVYTRCSSDVLMAEAR